MDFPCQFEADDVPSSHGSRFSRLYDQGTDMILVVAKTSLKNAYVLGK